VITLTLSWLMDQDQLDQAITFIWMTWRFWWLRGHVAEVARHWQTLMANSVRGQHVTRYLSEALGLNLFASAPIA
jgi:hypothetical protein